MSINLNQIILALFVILFGMAIGIHTKLSKQQKLDSRLKKIKKITRASTGFGDSNETTGDFIDYLKKIEHQLSSNFSGFTRDKIVEYRLKFEQAGLDATYAPAIIILSNVLCTIIFTLLYVGLLLFTKIGGSSFLIKIALFALFALLSVRLSEYVLDFKIKRRYKKIQKSLAFSVDMLAICTRSSLSLDQSFEKISEEMSLFNVELSAEFIRVATELRIIPDRTQALRNLARRVDIPMAHLLVSGLVHAIEQGVSIGQTLTNLSSEFSKHRLIMLEEKAAKLPVLLTIPLALFCLPATLIILAGPIFIKISQIDFLK